jgi:FkbM family methyltransferase
LFSVAAAALAGPRGQIFAFEADLDVARLLLETARLPANRCFAPISVLSLAVARNTGIASFAIASRARASNALAGFGASQMGGIAEVRLVPAMSLDDLRAALPAPTALKIDVEGAELLVLEGAQRVLKQDRPVVLCEVSHENNQAIATLLMNAGYRIFDGERQQATPAQGTTGMAPWNTIAIPAELAFAGFE